MKLPSSRFLGALLAVVALAVALAGSGAAATTATVGTSTPGSAFDSGGPGYLDVSGPYTSSGGAITALRAYVKGETKTVALRGVVYADAGGKPGTLIAVSNQISISAGAAAAWVNLAFPSSTTLANGSYWLGYWYGTGAGSGGGGFSYASASNSEYYAAAAYSTTSAPPSGFPSGHLSSSRYSVYATVTFATTTASAPSNSALPTISGSATVGQTLSAATGSWAGSPTSYAYQWKRCDSAGANCAAVSGASASTYALSSTDQGSTMRVTVTATNSTGSASATSAATGVVQASGSGSVSGSSTFYEDTREGFPKIAAYRPGCADGTTYAKFDWIVGAGYCAGSLDGGHALNPGFLGMVQPTGSGTMFAAQYGSYDTWTAAGGIRSFQSSDWLHNTDGTVHHYGSVNVLNWLSSDTATWSADVAAYVAKQDAAGHPGVMGIWGDNDLWGDQGYSFTGTAVSNNIATWDTNYVLHHNRLAADLPGWVIGGNDISSYQWNPSAYKGNEANGWALPGMSSAGMKECADKYYGLYNASGIDRLITGAQQYFAAKALDGKQRYEMLNNCNASSTQINRYSLAVATIGGYYYWPYTSGDWSTTLSIRTSIPDLTRNGVRNWLGSPTAAPQKVASGLWKRTFQHGVVYANMTGSTQTVDGHTLGNETGLFVSA